MKIAAIIITRNRKELLFQCIESVLSGSYVPEIIVVDNASTDGTEELICGKLPQIQYLKLHENLGPAGGAEAGQRFAYSKGYDFVWMLDDDVIVDKDSLKNLIESYKEITLKVSNQVYLTSVAYGDLQFNKPLYNLLRYNSFTGLTVRINENEYLKNHFPYDIGPMHGLFIPGKLFENIGFFNGKFFGWYDDTEFVIRAKKKGYLGFAIVESKIYHPTGFRKRVKILGKNFTFVSGRPIRMYLGTRNNIIAQRNFLPWFNFHFVFLPLFIIRRGISILFFYDNKRSFLKEFLSAIIDGIKGNLDLNHINIDV